MVFLLLSWIALFIVCGSFGGLVLRWIPPPSNTSRGVEFFLTLWLGLFLCGIALLGVSLWMPLNSWVGGIVLLIALALFRHHPARRIPPSRPWILAGLLLALCIVPAALQVITLRDTITYHTDIISWLARVGVVPGLAQFHSRFGFTSSWFCIPAVLDGDWAQARMTAVTGSFTIVLTSWQVCWALVRALRGRDQIADRLATFALLLAMFFPTLLNLVFTPSQDIPVAILTLLCFWTLLLDHPNDPARYRLLPVLFAALAITVKLSAIPLLAVCACIGFIRGRDRRSFALWGGALTLLILAPWLTAQATLSGWPLYPLGFPLDLPWVLETETQLQEIAQVRAYAPWPLLSELGWNGMVLTWLKQDTTNLLAAFYLLFGISAVFPIWRNRNHSPVPIAAFGLGVVGSFFWLWTTAHPRFGWGYLAILPSAWLLLPSLNVSKPLMVSEKMAMVLSVSTGILLFALPTLLLSTRSEKLVSDAMENGTLPQAGSRWILPPRVPAIAYSKDGKTVAPYTSPIQEVDWLPLPSRPMVFRLDPRDELRLRDPEKGLRGGVVPVGADH